MLAWIIAAGTVAGSVPPAAVDAGDAVASASAPAQATPPSAKATQAASIVLGPAAQGRAVIVDEQGGIVAHVTLVPGRTTAVGVPPGNYRIESEGRRVADVHVDPGATIEMRSPPGMSAQEPAPTPAASVAVTETPAYGPAAHPQDKHADAEGQPRTRRAKRKYKPVLAPLLSAILPGSGQVLTRRPGHGMAFFAGTAGLTIGAVALWLSGDRSEGATRGDEGASGSQEIIRLTGVAALSGAAALLYIGQILDAHGGAVGKVGPKVKPVTDHMLAFEVQRSSTVGFSPGQPEYNLLSDYSIAVMGQAAPRVTVGASDLSIKLEPERSGVVVQGGIRSAYRFLDKNRVWLSAGGGLVLQGTSARREVASVDPAEATEASDEGRFSAFAYAMLDTRIFVLNHWALFLAPRLSLPFSERRFGRERTIPRFSTTFELALGGAVHF